MPKYLAWVNSTPLNMRAYGQKRYKCLIFFYSLSLSSLVTLFFSLLLYSSSNIKPLIFSSFTLFSSHSLCFSLFLSASPCHLLDLMSISVALCVCVLQWFDTQFDNEWVEMVVGVLACGWVPKDGLVVGGLATTMGGCVGCSGSVVGCVFCFLFFFYFGGCELIFTGCDGLMLVGGNGCGLILVVFFFFLISWCWWMWVCAGGGCRYCCGSGCWWPLLRQWWLCHCYCCWLWWGRVNILF